MALGWEYVLAKSRDMETIGKLRRCHDRQLSVDLNKSGSTSGWTPTADRLSSAIWPWSTCIIAQHDGNPYWSGPIISRNISMAAGRATFSCVGWFERLMHLLLQDQQTQYEDQDAGFIISDLLTKARAQDPLLPITIGEIQLTQKRTISYGLDQSIGQAIQDLAELEAGVDWHIDPITRKLNILARRGEPKPDCKWTLIGDGKSQQSNCSEVVENVDGSTLVNQIRPRGQFGSGIGEDGPSQTIYGVFQEAPSLSDVKDSNILNAFAAGEIVYRSQPRVTYTITPKPSSKATVPKLFRDFDIGDTGFLTARRDFINVRDQATRMFGASLAISDTGVEMITNLQTTAN